MPDPSPPNPGLDQWFGADIGYHPIFRRHLLILGDFLRRIGPTVQRNGNIILQIIRRSRDLYPPPIPLPDGTPPTYQIFIPPQQVAGAAAPEIPNPWTWTGPSWFNLVNMWGVPRGGSTLNSDTLPEAVTDAAERTRTNPEENRRSRYNRRGSNIFLQNTTTYQPSADPVLQNIQTTAPLWALVWPFFPLVPAIQIIQTGTNGQPLAGALPFWAAADHITGEAQPGTYGPFDTIPPTILGQTPERVSAIDPNTALPPNWTTVFPDFPNPFAAENAAAWNQFSEQMTTSASSTRRQQLPSADRMENFTSWLRRWRVFGINSAAQGGSNTAPNDDAEAEATRTAGPPFNLVSNSLPVLVPNLVRNRNQDARDQARRDGDPNPDDVVDPHMQQETDDTDNIRWGGADDVLDPFYADGATGGGATGGGATGGGATGGGAAASAGGGGPPGTTPYFGAAQQEFFIDQWNSFAQTNVDSAEALDYGQFTTLAATIGGLQYGRNSPTFVPFLYLVANLNGGNYNTAQGFDTNGAPVNWETNFTDRQWRELNQLANNFNQWAANFAPGLIQTLMQFLTDVNQDPAAIQASQPATSGDAFVQYLQQLDPAEYAAQFITDAGGDAGSGSDQYDGLSWRSSMDRHDRSGVRRNLLTCADYGIVLPQDFNCSEIGDEDMCNGTLMYSEDNGKYKHCNWTNGACSSPSGPANIEGDLVYISDPDVACGTPFFNIRLPTSNCLNLDSDCNNFYSETSGINCCEYGTDENCSRGPGSEEGVCGESTGSTNIADDYQCFFSAEPSSEPDCSTFETQAGCLINRKSCTWNPDDNTCTEGEDPLRRSLRETDQPAPPPPPPPPPPPSGCMNDRATNYDPDATEDDGSCIIQGCTDPSASNYNQQANTDDDSCNFAICGPINLNSNQLPDQNLCSDIQDENTCSLTYFNLGFDANDGNDPTRNTYTCIWDEQGGSDGTGACSGYIGETTTYNQDSPSYRGTPITAEELPRLLRKCEQPPYDSLLERDVYKKCRDFIISKCDFSDETDNTADCITNEICAGQDPAGGPLVGTSGNFTVPWNMADFCGGGAGGRYGQRPNPDNDTAATWADPHRKNKEDMPGWQLNKVIIPTVNQLCHGFGGDGTIWDRSPTDPNFFDPPRRGTSLYYCNSPGVTNQIDSTDCDSNLSFTQSASTQESICNAQYTSDYKQCEWDSGIVLGGTCIAGSDCGGEWNNESPMCGDFGEYQCGLYSDDCEWFPPETRVESERERNLPRGVILPDGIQRMPDPYYTIGVCRAK